MWEVMNTMTTREAFETEARKHGFILDRLDKSGEYVQLITEQAWLMWQAATDAALSAPATVPETVAWLRAGAGLYCGYQTCEVNDENGFPVYRHPPATAPAWHDAQQAEIESLRWTVKDALESLDNGMTADCRATLSSATKETP